MATSSILKGRSVLVTGGTGSFGRKFIESALSQDPQRVIVFSRDELKQSELEKQFPPDKFPAIRYFIGDVRDAQRLRRAMSGVDYVVHAAALKQVPACEYNPIEAIKTNVHGAENIIEAAIDAGVTRVIALSTDKAVNPVNLYGATKLVAEKLFIQGNSYAGEKGPRFSVVRYGNVVGSRGSVVPLFREQRKTKKITITDARMTRFWITLDQGVEFVTSALAQMHGGEVFVPKLPSMNIMDLARAIAPGCAIDTIGIRAGEKLHESLISVDEARHSVELADRFVIKPEHAFWKTDAWETGKALAEGFAYASDTNDWWLKDKELEALAGGL